MLTTRKLLFIKYLHFTLHTYCNDNLSSVHCEKADHLPDAISDHAYTVNQLHYGAWLVQLSAGWNLPNSRLLPSSTDR